jgi:hypothetical protein
MKLVAGAALLAAAASAQNIEDLVNEFVSKIYQVDATGKVHNFNIEPYFVAEYECLGNGFKSGGYYGNGNGKIQYSEEAQWGSDSFSYKMSTNGKVSSAPLALVMEIPEEVSTDSFEEVFQVSGDMTGVHASMVGKIGSGSYDGKFALGFGGVQSTAKKFSIDATLNRKMVHTNVHPYWAGMMPPHGQTDVVLSASMKKACSENPLDRSCTAKVSVDGSHNGEDLGNTVAKYSVQKKRVSIVLSKDGNELGSVSVVGIDTMQVLALKVKCAGKPGVLVVQAVGPAGIDAVISAWDKFSAPFINFFSKIDFKSHHDAAHIIAYFDKVMQSVVGQNFFNVYPLIQSTQFESELLASALQVSSCQKAAQQYSETANQLIEQACKDNHVYVAEARDYVRKVVSDEGETYFNNWFSTL